MFMCCMRLTLPCMRCLSGERLTQCMSQQMSLLSMFLRFQLPYLSHSFTLLSRSHRFRHLRSQSCDDGVEACLVADEHLAWLAALCLAHDSSLAELVHKSSGTVISYGESALYHTGRRHTVHARARCLPNRACRHDR